MDTFLIVYLVIVYIVNIIFTGWLANEKHRSVGTWVFLSIILPGLSILAIAGAPIVQLVDESVSVGHSFKCPFCAYECVNTGSLINHLKSEHPDNIQKSLTVTHCPICGRDCETGESLETHIKYVHSDK